MNKQKHARRNQEQQIYPKRPLIKPIAVFDEITSINPAKLIKFVVGDYSSNTRVSSRALTSSDTAGTFDRHSTQLTLMKISSVVSAGRRGSKGVDLFSFNLIAKSFNRKGVASINLLNILPADQVITKGISNLDSLIKENELGINKYLIADRADNAAPECGNYKTKVKSIINKLQIQHGANHQKGHGSKDITAFWSKYFNVVHQSIFSCTQLKWVA